MPEDEGVLFEARGPGGQPVIATSVDELLVRGTARTLESVFSVVRRLADAYSTAVDGSAVTSGHVEFGLDLTANGEVYVVNGEAAASVRVRLNFGP